MLAPISVIVIGGVQLTTDPLTYLLEWPRRQMYISGVNGSGTTQDFGQVVSDLVLSLESGDGQYLDTVCVHALDVLFKQPGGVYPFTDGPWGTVGTVHIETFETEATMLSDCWRYRLRLRAATLTKWHGFPYPPV